MYATAATRPLAGFSTGASTAPHTDQDDLRRGPGCRRGGNALSYKCIKHRPIWDMNDRFGGDTKIRRMWPMNIAVARAADGLPRRAFTVDDINRMMEVGIFSEDERFELIEGDLVMMSPTRAAHERVKNALDTALVRALPENAFVSIEGTIKLAHDLLVSRTSRSFRRPSTMSTPDICATPSGRRPAVDRGRRFKHTL